MELQGISPQIVVLTPIDDPGSLIEQVLFRLLLYDRNYNMKQNVENLPKLRVKGYLEKYVLGIFWEKWENLASKAIILMGENILFPR